MCVMQCVARDLISAHSISVSAPDHLTSVALLCTSHPSLKADPCVRARARAANIYYERSSQRSGQSVSVSGVTSDSKDLPTPGHPVTIEC